METSKDWLGDDQVVERPVRGPDTGYTEVGARVGRCDLIGLTEAFVYSRPFQS